MVSKKNTQRKVEAKRKKQVIREANATKANPFEFRVTKNKHSVANARNTQSTNLTRSRTEALEKRKQTLLPELSNAGKESSFVDRRWGEHDASLSLEDKTMMRFQKTRMRQMSKGDSIYNLNDEEELTHLGKSIGATDDYAGDIKDDESMDSFDEEKERDDQFGFGGLSLKRKPQAQLVPKSNGKDQLSDDDDLPEDVERRKSKREIMKELMSKSKFFKYQAQQELEQRMDKTHRLDEEYRSMIDLIRSEDKKLSATAPPSEPKEPAEEDQRPKEEGEEEKEKQDKGELDDWTKLAKSFADPSMKRAQASNPLKTEEDLARAEQGRLIQLETLRLKRMTNEELDEEDLGSKKMRRKEKKAKDAATPRGPDDIDSGDEQYLPEMGDSSVEESDEEESGEAEENGDEGAEQSPDAAPFEQDSDLESDAEANGEDSEEGGLLKAEDVDSDGEQTPRDSKKRKRDEVDGSDEEAADSPAKKPKTAVGEIFQLGPNEAIPFVFAIPPTFDDFNVLLSNQTVGRQKVILQRMRATNHPSLSADNKAKMKIFFTYVFRRIMLLGAASSVDQSELPMEEIDLLLVHLFEVAQFLPEHAARICRDYITQVDSAFRLKLTDTTNPSVAPRLQWIVMFKAIAYLWPTSDRRHSVVTPAMMLMAEILAMTRVGSLRDLSRLLLFTNVFIYYLQSATRYASEPFTVLFGVLNAFLEANSDIKPSVVLNPLLVIPPTLVKLAATANHKSKFAPQAIDVASLRNSDDKSTDLPTHKDKQADEIRFNILATTVKVLDDALHVYKKESAVVENFVLAQEKLAALAKATWLPPALKTLVNVSVKKIGATTSDLVSARTPLRLFAKQIEAPKDFTPDFMEVYEPQKGIKDTDKQQRILRKLRKKVRKEQKGAERELKRDTQFIQAEKFKKKQLQDRQSASKHKQVMSWLQNEQANINTEAKQAKKQKKQRSALPL